jgi:two-component system CheB/CheR fusion protein
VELEARLIDDLLDVTRIVRGKVELDKRPIELCTIVRRAVEVCKEDIDARRLHFGMDLGPASPYWIEADAARLQQVFWNLLKNAIKFTPLAGCVGIRCHPENGHVVIELKDSGAGIEPEALARIFNPFEQAERSITRQFGGLGLGLTISKALVEMHGGSIEAFSDGKGKGAMFRVTLPLVSARLAEETRQLPPVIDSSQPATRSLRILLVEDHGDTARIMRQILSGEGHVVQTAGDVAMALERAGHETFDLVISDLGLPDGSGVDMMRTLRATGQRMPAIALSGYGQEEDMHRSREAGFAEHLIKPVSIDHLLSAIGRLAPRQQADSAT